MCWACSTRAERASAWGGRRRGSGAFPVSPRRPRGGAPAQGGFMDSPPLAARRFGQNIPLGVGWGLRMSAPARVLAAIAERNRRGIPIAIVVHPWEIDRDPPRVTLPLAKQFAHYFRLGGFQTRLEQIIRGATFAPMGEVLGLS